MTERLGYKRSSLYKDKITCLVSHSFVVEKANYTYIFGHSENGTAHSPPRDL